MTKDKDNHVVLKGKVIRGRGRASSELGNSIDEIQDLTGSSFFPGSLNIVLFRPKLFKASLALKFDKGRRFLWPAEICGHKVWIYRWIHAPLHAAEVIADVNLRIKFGLTDNKGVSLKLPDKYVDIITIKERFAWYAFWSWRQGWSYHKEWYYAKSKAVCKRLGATQRAR